MAPPVKGVCFFGGYDAQYPRSSVIRSGLAAIGVDTYECHASSKLKFPRRYQRLTSVWKKIARAFDVVFVPEFGHKDVILASLLCRRSGKLCVFDPLVSRYDTKIKDRGDAPEFSFQAWHNRNIDRWSMNLPDVLLADTRAHANYYERNFLSRGREARVLRVGYDDKLFRPSGRSAADSGKTEVLFYGSYLPLHGVDTIVRAAVLLRSRAEICFRLVGGGQTFEDVKRVVQLANIPTVRLQPPVPMAELPRLIERASICLGIFGGTEKAQRVVPNKLYQCMAMGKPVITADSPAVREVFRPDDNVVVVPAGDAEGLAAAIERLANDPTARARIGASAQTVCEAFRPSEIGAQFVKYCEEERMDRRWK